MRNPIRNNGIDHGASVTRTREEELVTVTAWPDEVQIVVHAPAGNLTIDQAKEVVELLQLAIDQAPRLDIDDNGVLTQEQAVTR